MDEVCDRLTEVVRGALPARALPAASAPALAGMLAAHTAAAARSGLGAD